MSMIVREGRSMSRPSIDRARARAESALDRLDDDREDLQDDPIVLVDSEDASTMHVDDGEPATDEDELLDPPGHPDESLSDALDAFLEAFNARDLDTLLETVTEDVEVPGLGYDIDNFPEALEDLWERRPSVLLTRGRLDGDRCVAVIWELGTDGWWRIGVVHVDDPVDGRLGVVEFNDDPAVLEEVATDPPDGDVEEGARWEEWEEGAPPES